MIRPPRRSVTRFFIPLIDVLTLLFCIFLLMPAVSIVGEGAGAESVAAREQRIRQLEHELDLLKDQAREPPRPLTDELRRLREEKMQTLKDRLKIRVLEIDSATGKLFYHDPERIEIQSEAQARALIEQDRPELQGKGRELYYLILYPRDRNSLRPHREQREQYDRWLAEVAHGWDIPGPAASGGKP